MYRRTLPAACLFVSMFLPVPALASSLLIVPGPGGGGFGGYADPGYGTYTGIFDTTFGVPNITLAADLSNPAQVNAHDAIVVELRNSADTLSAAEIANLTAFVSSGRRVALFGENSGWAAWDSSILSVVGGGYGGEVPITGPDGTFVNYLIPVSSFSHPLTSGMTEILQMHGSVAVGGTPLFDYANIGTLWGSGLNVLTYLSFNEFFSGGDPSEDVFNQNIADWLFLSSPAAQVLEPGTLALLAVGLGAVGCRKRRRSQDRRTGLDFASRGD